jgi:hypothetical protein
LIAVFLENKKELLDKMKYMLNENNRVMSQSNNDVVSILENMELQLAYLPWAIAKRPQIQINITDIAVSIENCL